MIKYIQILRIIAACWVAIFHGTLVGMFTGVTPWADVVINFGYAGVDIFFVISGVIMAHSTRNTSHGLRAAGAFFLIRFSRIYTGWWPAMLLYVVFFIATNQLVPQIDLQASFFLYFRELSGLINIAIWSLMYELYFYVLVSIALLLSAWRRQIFMRVIFVVLVLINIYLLITRSTTNPEVNWIQMFYIAPIVLEFFMGYFLYQYTQQHSRLTWKVWTIIAAVFISLTIYLTPNFADHPYGLANSYYWPERAALIGGAALSIVGLALNLPSPKNKIALIIAKFGDYSYSIYLLHILAFNMTVTLLPWGSFDNRFRIIIAVTTMVVLLLGSAAYYHWVEHPIYMYCRNSIKRWLSVSS